MLSTSQLPLTLDFSSAISSTVVDKSGKGTGFSGTQAGVASSINLNTTAGTLSLSADNSTSKPTTALETAFDGTTRGFTITSRLLGPLSQIVQTGDQAGIFFGPDVNNTVKLVAIKTASGEFLQFEAIVGGKIVGTDSASYVSLGTTFATIKTLDVQLTGDSVTGTLTARYSVNGKAWTKLAFGVAIPDASNATFFNSNSKAGLIVSDRHTAITDAFDQPRDPGLQRSGDFVE
jgi:hypothetical protein